MTQDVLVEQVDLISELQYSFPDFLEFATECRKTINKIVAHCVEKPYSEYKTNGTWRDWDPSIKELVK